MNKIYNSLTDFIMTPKIFTQTVMYSIPGLSMGIRYFQYDHCFEVLEKKEGLNAANFSEQQTKFQKGCRTGLQIQLAVAISFLAIACLFPFPSSAYLICATTHKVFLGGFFGLYLEDAFWKLPLCQRLYASPTVILRGG